MGKLVTFEKRPPAKPLQPPPNGQAEIVLFTGVRYERSTPEPGKPPATSTPKRRRS